MLNQKVIYDSNAALVAALNSAAARLAEGSSLTRKVEHDMAVEALPLIRDLTPIRSGSWRQSWFENFERADEGGTFIQVSTLTRNPLGSEKPYQYAPRVHAMGGRSRSGHERAVLDVFMDQHSDQILQKGEDSMLLSLRVFS